MLKSKRKVYLDYASLTPIDKRVMKEVVRLSAENYANPSSIHTPGAEAKKILEQSRRSVADFIHAHSDEIFFTASGTEANNIAIGGVVEAMQGVHMHILTSTIEHASVLETVKKATKNNQNNPNIKVDFIPVTREGIINLAALKALMRPETLLVSIMLVNNEIGTIQPIREAVKIVRDFAKTAGSKILFHTDACQAPVYLDINMETLGVDLLTLDSNKVYGPRGVGVLYKRRKVKIGSDIMPIMAGGGQENGLRPGTENVPAIAGFTKALFLAAEERTRETVRLLKLRDYFIEELKKRLPDIILNGSYGEGRRLVNNINVTGDFDHEFFLLELDVRGIACSTKSACLRDEDESYVVRALRAADTVDTVASAGRAAAQSIRFSLGRFTMKKDIDYTLKMIDEIISLRL